AVIGLSLAGFMTKVQPAASAGPIFRVSIAAGKFHGVIAATTPTGFLHTCRRFPGPWAGIVSPYILFASSANHSIKEAAYLTSPRDSLIGFPISSVMIRASSSVFSNMSSRSEERRVGKEYE